MLSDNSKLYNSILDWNTLQSYADGHLISDIGLYDEELSNNSEYIVFSTDKIRKNTSSLPSYSAPLNITPSMFPLYLYSDEPKSVFLGVLSNNKFDAESVSNTYGNYGSEYSDTSIFNNYGDYGSPYSSTSAFNKYATNPPLICDAYGNTLGRLTENTIFIDGYTWNEISAMMK